MICFSICGENSMNELNLEDSYSEDPLNSGRQHWRGARFWWRKQWHQQSAAWSTNNNESLNYMIQLQNTCFGLIFMTIAYRPTHPLDMSIEK